MHVDTVPSSLPPVVDVSLSPDISPDMERLRKQAESGNHGFKSSHKVGIAEKVPVIVPRLIQNSCSHAIRLVLSARRAKRNCSFYSPRRFVSALTEISDILGIVPNEISDCGALSAILNIFSFALIIPILQILFKMDTKTYEFIPLGCGRNQHERYSGQQLLLLRHRDDSLAGRLIDIADFRRLPGGDDPAESILLFRLFRRDDSSPHGRGARHPCASI